MSRLFGNESLSQVARRVAFAVVVGVAGCVVAAAVSELVVVATNLWVGWHPLLWFLPLFGVLGIALYEGLGLKTWVGTVDGPSEVFSDVREDVAPSWRLAPAVIGGTCLTLAGGGVVGPDAAVKQTGAVLGPIIAKPFKLGFIDQESRVYLGYKRLTKRMRKLFPKAAAVKDAKHPCLHWKDVPVGPVGYAAMAGMGAAFSALLCAPLGVLAYVLEVGRQNHVRVRQLGTILLACIAGAVIAKLTGVGFRPEKVVAPSITFDFLLVTVVVGLCSGLLCVLYRTGMAICNRVVRKRINNPYLSVLLGGLLVCVLIHALKWEDYAGLHVLWIMQSFEWTVPFWGFLVECLLIILTLGLGLRGGEVTIVFIMGSLLGASIASVTGMAPAPVCAIALGTFFGLASGCPLAGLLCGCEFYGWGLFLPLLVAIVVGRLLEYCIFDRMIALAIRWFAERVQPQQVWNWFFRRESSQDRHPGTDHVMKHKDAGGSEK